MRVRVPVPVGSAAGAVLGAGERICAECHSRRRPGAMVQCQACLRWFHRSCGGVASSQSVRDWVCSPCAVVLPVSPVSSLRGSPSYIPRRQRREGPWRSRLGRYAIFLSFFLSSVLAASAAGVCQACKDPRFKKKQLKWVITVVAAQHLVGATCTWPRDLVSLVLSHDSCSHVASLLLACMLCYHP
jgi:hypothetical protein